jgi:hypothetical protein
VLEDLSESKIRNDEVTMRVNQYVLWLDVPVNNPVAVDMMDPDELIAGQNTDSQS